VKKKQKKAPPKFGRARDNGWYEVVDTAIDARLIRNVQEAEGFRCFIRGPIGDVQIVEVPTDMPEVVRDALGKRLSAMGITCLLVNENIKFYRLRRASHEEEKKLDAAQKQDATAPARATTDDEAPEGAGVRSVAGSDGSERDQPAGDATAPGDDQDPDAGSVEDRSGP
jgi:hypothetical protein